MYVMTIKLQMAIVVEREAQILTILICMGIGSELDFKLKIMSLAGRINWNWVIVYFASCSKSQCHAWESRILGHFGTIHKFHQLNASIDHRERVQYLSNDFWAQMFDRTNLTPKGPRPFFCEKTLKTAISIAKSKKIWKLFYFFAHLTIGSYT